MKQNILPSTEISSNQQAFELGFFFKMGEQERFFVKQWYEQLKDCVSSHKKFLRIVEEAVAKIDYDYSISSIEPSIDKNGNLYFAPGENVVSKLTIPEWIRKAGEFAPSRKSRLASIHELYLWYAYRVAKGCWTLEYVCNNSSEGSNYVNSVTASFNCEKSAKRCVGGAFDGVGNTQKLVTHNNKFALCGGSHYTAGYNYPVGSMYYLTEPVTMRRNATTGVVVLLK